MKYKRIADPVDTDELCSYGCGRVAKFKNGSGKLMCCERHTQCPANIKRNSDGTKRAYEQGTRPPGWSHLTTEQRANKKDKFSADFSYGGIGSHKKVLITERGRICECCKLSTWLELPITLELEHIDGDNQNNVKSNLKLLCPNCHSQTETWKGKNKNGYHRIKISDEDWLNAILTTKNIRQALLKLGLTPKAANYEKAYEIKYANVVEGNTQRA